jgi:methyl-accepting chemotaxis protein
VNPLERWINGIEAWRRALTAELVALPETLALFREGVSNFQRITGQLLDVTDAIEQVTSLYVSGMADIGHKMEEAAKAMRDQVASVGNSDRVSSAAEEVTRALSAMADLNPLWRRSHPHDS